MKTAAIIYLTFIKFNEVSSCFTNTFILSCHRSMKLKKNPKTAPCISVTMNQHGSHFLILIRKNLQRLKNLLNETNFYPLPLIHFVSTLKFRTPIKKHSSQ